jgi:hypothetical protein
VCFSLQLLFLTESGPQYSLVSVIIDLTNVRDNWRNSVCETGRQNCDTLNPTATLNSPWCTGSSASSTPAGKSNGAGQSNGGAQSSPTITPAASNTYVSLPSLTTTNTAVSCLNLPGFPEGFPDFCSYEECFAAKEQCLEVARQCLQEYPDINTSWYFTP